MEIRTASRAVLWLNTEAAKAPVSSRIPPPSSSEASHPTPSRSATASTAGQPGGYLLNQRLPYEMLQVKGCSFPTVGRKPSNAMGSHTAAIRPVEKMRAWNRYQIGRAHV